MKRLNHWTSTGVLVALTGVAGAAQPPMTPPPEALAACANKALDSACTVVLPDRSLQGNCRQVPSGQTACVPAGGVRPPMGQSVMNMGQLLPPGGGVHSSTITQLQGRLTLVPATQDPIAASRITMTIQGDKRLITANGISKHKTGAYPNAHNPNTISEQRYQYKVPLNPVFTGQVKAVGLNNFGIAVNGVTFDPTAAEAYLGNRNWMYEPLNGAINLGLDVNYAHTQPNGAYHYHGKPTGLMQALGVNSQKHSPLIGWAADGFPIYALSGSKTANTVAVMRSSYRLKSGSRPAGDGNPTGQYDGTFVQDYEYVAGLGDLDECNGAKTVSAEFPQGSYAYFITDAFPAIPRCFKGSPSSDFMHRIPGLRPRG